MVWDSLQRNRVCSKSEHPASNAFAALDDMPTVHDDRLGHRVELVLVGDDDRTGSVCECVRGAVRVFDVREPLAHLVGCAGRRR